MDRRINPKLSGIYPIYKSISAVLIRRGYTCEYHSDLIRSRNEEDFLNALNNMRFQFDAELVTDSLMSKLTSIWKKVKVRGVNVSVDPKKDRILVYFTDVVSMKKMQIAKSEVKNAWTLLVNNKVHHMIFIHKHALSPNASRMLTDAREIPENEFYEVEVFHESELLIDVANHVWSCKHSVISDKEEFFKRNKFVTVSQMPTIYKDDPAIKNLGVQIGDVIRIERKGICGSVPELYFRLVIMPK